MGRHRQRPNHKGFLFMTIEEKTALIERYSNYELSNQFILACFEVFKGEKEKIIVNFIKYTFLNNDIQDCSYLAFRRLASHWLNVSKDKLESEDYRNHIYASVTAAKFRCVSRFLESHFSDNDNKGNTHDKY